MSYEVKSTNVYRAVAVQPQIEQMIKFVWENNNIADGRKVLTDEDLCSLLGVEGVSDYIVFIESGIHEREPMSRFIFAFLDFWA